LYEYGKKRLYGAELDNVAPPAYIILRNLVESDIKSFERNIMILVDLNGDGKVSEGEYLKGVVTVFKVVSQAAPG